MQADEAPPRVGWRDLSPTVRLLIVNVFGINLGFFMVLPFLATHLRDDLGFAAALVGTIMGLRTLFQQGLYVVGGTAADRLDLRLMIMLGCGLRVVAFGLFAVVTSPAGIITATAITGVAGAIFAPASQTYLAHSSPGRRAETFAWVNVAANAGVLIGPLLGALLLAIDFRLVSALACGVFAILTIAQGFVLPAMRRPGPSTGILQSWREVVTNRRFFAYTLAGSAYFALFNQLYLAIPLEAQRVTGHTSAVTAVFVVSTAVGLTSGVRLVTACRRRWRSAASMALGLSLLAAGFLPAAVAAPLIPTATSALEPAAALTAALPVLAGTAVFSAGVAITSPFMLELIPIIGSERLSGTYYGFFYLVSSLLAAAVSSLTGALLDLDGLRWLPFFALFAVGAAGSAGMAWMRRPVNRLQRLAAGAAG
ncbi:MFS transporter [Actinoplanes sp. NPDC026670]|uniref:MFS transporter n=1 Tax=Actinoplanes sp. NPDC026670 TaxID=3154700 RepID=UPI0033DEC2EB